MNKVRHFFKYIFFTFSVLLTGCYHCTEQKALDSLIMSYNNNRSAFDSIPNFLENNQDSIDHISYYNYEYQIGFRTDHKNIVNIKHDSVEQGLIKNEFIDIESTKRIIDLMKNENLEYLGISNKKITITNFCGGHYFKDGQIYLRYGIDFEESEKKNIIKKINIDWTIMKR
ncbi:hypothetical protein [Mangrovimonas sp. YM274]|uniref:hypothetical protein n=1 Tax=Mangrovimonas sp. YM274 TaxID=3070660 RepID=UPI0027DB0E69|nr:hypothetical protein [Mangrovimonas sp. YM274]WMI68200.1 hypothetical protein RBH95_13730 [Mangrovimonas sp. YM274]